ncbi:hypothetical protein GILI108418_13000 [Gillisia limnaea]|uniref:Lipoprotein n=1 Tax=Gillisia limnaea (strain DSM 15749 / LMG 21470 / R-8282) TaxID=865937 RepID=H2BXL7_GILLR|nr:hypothetical protein Gilli_2519 [Gillisia limnaea DSM 15749]
MIENRYSKILKLRICTLIFSLVLSGCQNNSKVSEEKPTQTTVERVQTTSSPKQTGEALDSPSSEKPLLVITSNALQIVSRPSGSTTELPTGMEMGELSKIVANVLNTEIPEPQVNSECGAGAMTMLIWGNGLNLMFQKGQGSESDKMLFVGWSLGEFNNEGNLTTMAGIGVGSKRSELEAAYTIEVKKTTLGYEFSTGPEGLYGILKGPSPDDKIEFMWSGLSCNFR